MKRAKVTLDGQKIKSLVKPTKKKVILLAAIIAVAVIIGTVASKGKKSDANTERADDIVTRGDVALTITGSATVEPLERYEIIPKVSGDIIYCPYEVGDEVHKDDILYKFDSSDSDLNVERQRVSMQQSQNSYRDALEERDKLSLKAKNDGVISGLTIKKGNEVKTGTKIASVEDTSLLEAVIPFTQAQINSIHIGDAATVTSSKHMSSVNGTVTHKASGSYAGSDGSTLYDVTIQFANPGAFYAGLEVGGSVGANISPGKGTIANTASGTIEAEVDGTVSKVYYSNGDYVKAGTVIAVLTSDTVSDKIENSTLSLRSADLSMQQTEKDLENYSISSPINGTVITKNSKAGDTIDKTNSSTTMMVVADISKLKFSLEIDELDISKVHEGQEVAVTCDALPSEEFAGIITNVSVEGTAQNGVTTYSAEVEIEEPGNLRPSMNIDAEIIVESAENVLLIPTADIKTVGGKSFVFVKDDGKHKGKMTDGADGEKPFDAENGEHGAEFGGEKASQNGAKVPQNDEKASQNGSGAQNGGKKDMSPAAPDGYILTEIETGVANEDYTEVISGLSEGQEVYAQSSSSSNSNSNAMMPGGMGGGMPSGMSGGGMPGGMGGAGGGQRGGGQGGMR